MRKANLLATYAYYLSYSIGVQIVIDAIYLYAFFSHSRESLIERCIDGSTDQDVKNICDNSFDTGKLTMLISIVLGLIVQLCELTSIPSFVK